MDVLKSRIAVSFAFFINGIVFATWATNIPFIQTRFELSESTLGFILLLMGIGAVLVMALTGWLNYRVGSRIMTLVASLGYLASLPLLFLSYEAWQLYLAAFLFGAGNGAMDVAMNDQAVIVEQQFDRPIMSSFHAQFSIGGLIGSVLTVLNLRMDNTPLLQALLTILVLTPIAIILFRYLPHKKTQTAQHTERFQFHSVLLILAIVSFMAFMSEGTIADWGALYLRDEVNVSNSTAALSYASFSIAMVVGRLHGDFLVKHIGRTSMLFFGGILFGSGMGMMLILPSLAVSLTGFILAGLGLANIIPILFSRAGNLEGVPSSIGITAMSISGYSGYLLGPPIIGSLAHWQSLPAALSLIVIFGVFVMLVSRRC